ncbi:hypothetical protein M3J09_012253 [Ascochyta lentis]
MASPTLSLLSLPPELILEIADYLPPDGILALKFSHRILNYSLPLAPRLKTQTLSRCASLAIRSYLCRPNPKPTHLRCILCKIVYPVKSFRSSSSPACESLSSAAALGQADVVELPQRLCAWHVGRLARIVHTEPGGKNEWVSSSEDMCMHCGVIQSWAECDCACDSCSVKAVTAYTRYLNNKTECREFVFYRKPAGDGDRPPRRAAGTQLFVRELCLDSDTADQTRVIHMPVCCSDDLVSKSPTMLKPAPQKHT